MPYKLNASGKGVMVKKGSAWVMLKAHPDHAKALAHLRALMANVPEAKGKAKAKK
jgi:hypothetical protein